MGCGEDLRDAAAAVVADEIDVGDRQRVEKFAQHRGIGGHRHVLGAGDLGVAVRQQVQRDTATRIEQMRKLMTP